MNGLLMFLGLLGGVSLFGLLGIVLGPLVSAIVTGLFEAYTAPGDLISGSATKSEDRNETARDTLSVGLFMDSATVQQFPALAHTRGWVEASRQRHNTISSAS